MIKLTVLTGLLILTGCVGSQPIKCGYPSNFIVNELTVNTPPSSEQSTEK